MITEQQAEAHVLRKLFSFRGGKHTHMRNIVKGVAPQDIPLVEAALKRLCKMGWVIVKPTNNGKHVSLNPAIAREAHQRLRDLEDVY